MNYHQTNSARAQSDPVLFDLYHYAPYTNVVAGLQKGEVDLIRCDPAAYVLLRQKDTNITLLVRQAWGDRQGLRSVIFVRADADINRLEELKGRAFAFGDRDSTIGDYLPKAALVACGLRASHFQSLTNLSSFAVLTAVRTGQFDAGVSAADQVANAIHAGARLRVLQELPSPAVVWLAANRPDQRIVRSIAEGLLSLRDVNVLAAVDYRLTGFEPIRASDYNELERQIEKAKQFNAPP
jgi:phosphonate transport system substrate-binding protein